MVRAAGYDMIATRVELHQLAALAQVLAEAELPASDIAAPGRSEEHTSELQSLMRISYAVFCLKKKNIKHNEIMRDITHKSKYHIQLKHVTTPATNTTILYNTI